MPEGPEVKMFAHLLNETLADKHIRTFEIKSGRYTTEVPHGIGELITPTRVLKVACKGKFLYFALARGKFIWQTLGLTGKWSTKEDKWTRFVINDNLFYSDQRNFGTIKFGMSRRDTVNKLETLGNDFLNGKAHLQAAFTAASMVREQEKTLAQILMDQSKFPGVGNYIKAEALYRAKLSPHRTGVSLTSHEAMELVAQVVAVMHEAWHSYIYPDDCQFNKVIYGRIQDPHGNSVLGVKTKDKRTTYWVPAVQK